MRFLAHLCAPVILFLAAVQPAAAGKYVEVLEERLLPEPKPGHAIVFVIRPQRAKPNDRFYTFFDDQLIGILKARTYVFAHVPAGRHLFWAKAGTVSGLELEVEEGKTYHFKAAVRIILRTTGVKLLPLNAEDSAAELAKCKTTAPTDEGRKAAAAAVANRLQDARKNAAKREE